MRFLVALALLLGTALAGALVTVVAISAADPSPTAGHVLLVIAGVGTIAGLTGLGLAALLEAIDG